MAAASRSKGSAADACTILRVRGHPAPDPLVRLGVSREALAQMCLRSYVRELSFFGSVVRDGFEADSDVDLLVEFDPAARISLLDVSRIEREFSQLFGRRVDLVTKSGLSRWIRDDVLQEVVCAYQAARSPLPGRGPGCGGPDPPIHEGAGTQ